MPLFYKGLSTQLIIMIFKDSPCWSQEANYVYYQFALAKQSRFTRRRDNKLYISSQLKPTIIYLCILLEK